MPGLSSAEAAARLARVGANRIPVPERSALAIVAEKFRGPIPWMLEAAALLELVRGKAIEAAIIAALLVINAAISLVQEGRAQSTLRALQAHLALNASVCRDDQWVILPAAGLVPGDLVKLSLGAVVPADVRLVSGDILVDQSMLTGESLPVEAGAGASAWSGGLVRRGEAVAEVVATGAATRFGKSAELIGKAHVVSTQQKAVFRIARNLAVINGVIICLLVAGATWLRLPLDEVISLGVTAVLAAIPVALPATFTLAAALGARVLARNGVLPTRLSAIDEAASIDILCSDKTGTLTRNSLQVAEVQPLAGFTRDEVLMLAALASARGGQDPVDQAIHAMADAASLPATAPKLLRFTPFDPTTKRAEAVADDPVCGRVRVTKGAFAAVSQLATAADDRATALATALESRGYRTLAVAVGPESGPESGADGGALRLAGLIALTDPPRPDAAALISRLRALDVRTVMVTGDAPKTAAFIAGEVGLDGAVFAGSDIPATIEGSRYAVFAGTLPEDKFRLVKALQAGGHTVGMCGDGANDAPALRQAQMGIAVSTATDVAKSAAGLVLTAPGLSGVVAAIEVGRQAFQRVRTYALNTLTKKTVQALFLAVGLAMTGGAILTPHLMVLIMITGDGLGMALTTDNVSASASPNRWDITRISIDGVLVGLGELVFCTVALAIGVYHLQLDPAHQQTLAFLLIVFGNQATCYVNRERRHWWSTRPSNWLLAASAVDIGIALLLATIGLGMAALPLSLGLATLGGAVVFLIVFDLVKQPILRAGYHLAR